MTGGFCTVVADASYCRSTGIGGWAAWVACDGKRKAGYGALKVRASASLDAEIMAIINGLHLAERHFSPDRFHVVTDCLIAIDMLKGKVRKRRAKEASDQWRSHLDKIVAGRQITFAHVKGHTRDAAARSYCNRWCDKHARSAMKTKRKEESRNATEIRTVSNMPPPDAAPKKKAKARPRKTADKAVPPPDAQAVEEGLR